MDKEFKEIKEISERIAKLEAELCGDKEPEQEAEPENDSNEETGEQTVPAHIYNLMSEIASAQLDLIDAQSRVIAKQREVLDKTLALYNNLVR